jgi:hypothetical protein
MNALRAFLRSLAVWWKRDGGKTRWRPRKPPAILGAKSRVRRSAKGGVGMKLDEDTGAPIDLASIGVPPDARIRSLAKDIRLNWVPDGWLRPDEGRRLANHRVRSAAARARQRGWSGAPATVHDEAEDR